MRARGICIALFTLIATATTPPAWADGQSRFGASTLVPGAVPGGVPTGVPTGAAARPLDTDAFLKRLKKVRGVSLLSRVRLAVRINRFARRFSHYHEGKGAKRLPDLRRRFNVLHASLASLIRPKNPRMHAFLIRSREALWRAFAVRGLFYAGFGRDFRARDKAPAPLTLGGSR